MVWDLHNQRIIVTAGMAWDTGAPIWPYQTPNILFFALNTPAFVVAVPVSHLLGLSIPYYYLVLFPCVLVWWWFVGLVLDRKLLKPEVRKGWPRIALSAGAAVIFIILGAFGTLDAFHWWHTYGDGFLNWSNLVLLRALAPAIWCFAFGSVSTLYAKQFVRIKLETDL